MIFLHKNIFFKRAVSTSVIAGLMTWIVLFSIAEYCFCKQENPSVEITIYDNDENNCCSGLLHSENFSVERKIVAQNCSNLPVTQPVLFEQKNNKGSFVFFNQIILHANSSSADSTNNHFRSKSFQIPDSSVEQIKKIQLLI